MPRPRRAVAVACIALVVVVAVLPLGGLSLDWVVVPTPFVLLQPMAPTGAFVEWLHREAPPVAVRCPVDPRGPPSLPLA